MSSQALHSHTGRLQASNPVEVMHLKCVTFRYNKEIDAVLSECNGVVCKGTVTIIQGRNGSGKSTLSRLLAGVMSEHEGMMEGQLLIAEQPKPLIGYIGGEAAQQFVIGVVEDELAFGPENLGLPIDEIDRRVERELKAVDMAAYRTARVEHLSGGQQQRVAAAAVWTMNPDILIVDDAWSSLDTEGRERFTEALYRWFTTSPHKALIVSTSRSAELNPTHALWDNAICWRLEAGHLYTSSELELFRDTAAPSISLNHAETIDYQETNCHQEGMEAPYLLELDRVAVGYRSGSTPLCDVSAGCRPGDGILLRGSNGTGKSTLLKLLCGFLRPLKGKVRISGKDLHRLHSYELAQLAGYVPQRAAASFMTERVIDECMEVYRELKLASPDAQEWSMDQLQRIQLDSFAELHPHDLSASAQRMLSMWIATVHRPQILLLDEPTAGLDEQAALDIVAWCQRERARGAIVIASTHDPLWFLDNSWQHWHIADGKVQWG